MRRPCRFQRAAIKSIESDSKWTETPQRGRLHRLSYFCSLFQFLEFRVGRMRVVRKLSRARCRSLARRQFSAAQSRARTQRRLKRLPQVQGGTERSGWETEYLGECENDSKLLSSVAMTIKALNFQINALDFALRSPPIDLILSASETLKKLSRHSTRCNHALDGWCSRWAPSGRSHRPNIEGVNEI